MKHSGGKAKQHRDETRTPKGVSTMKATRKQKKQNPATDASPSTALTPAIQEIAVEAITRHPANPRTFRKKDKDDPALAELAASIKAVGLLEPILLRPAGEGFQLLAGERRWRAAKLAGFTTIPAIVREMDDRQALEVLVTENLQRESLQPIEEARAIRALIEGAGWNAADVADRLGKSPAWVAQRARLTELSQLWQDAIADPDSPVSRWPVSHLLLVAKLEPPSQDELAEMTGWVSGEEPVPERPAVAFMVAERLRTLKLAPWKLGDEALYPEAGACTSCRKRTSCHPDLFDEDSPKEPGKDEKCMDKTCWDEKVRRFLTAREAALRAEHHNLVLIHNDGGRHFGNDGALEPYQYQSAKRNDPEARPALIVDGKGTGTLRWIRPDTPAPASRNERPKDAHGNPVPTPLSERREALAKRRTVRAVEIITKAIQAIAPFPRPPHVVDPIMQLILPLAAVFGTEHKRDSSQWVMNAPGNGENHTPQSAWTTILPSLSADPAGCTEALWHEVCPVILRRLQYQGTATDVAKLWEDAIHACGALGINHEAAMDEATKAIPQPKAWASLNEDGTPKACSKGVTSQKEQPADTPTAHVEEEPVEQTA